MTEIIVDTNRGNGREFRTVTASTKVTDQELAELENAAARRGVRLGEWIRDVLFREAKLSSDVPDVDPEMVEIIGLQMFLTRVLSAIASGERMTREQCQDLMRNVKTNKRRAAQDALAQYRNGDEEEHHG
ncbi:MAG: hypothetical protein ACLGXA_18095 [Acidobacteriota bacterium]